MSYIKTEISPFLLHGPHQENEAISLLVSRPTPQEVESLGRLFMILKVSPANEQTKKIISSIQQEGKNFYYQQLESNTELAFEAMLKKLNELLSGFLKHSSSEWLDNFSAIVGVVKDTELYFTQIGDLSAFLIHQNRIVNILDKTKGAEARINPLKIFSQTISGQLSPNDSLVFTSNSILDFISLERLRTIIQSGSPHQANQTLESLLAPSQHTQGFAALTIGLLPETTQVQPSHKNTQPTYSGLSSQESMNKLVSREESTDQLLTPSTWSYFYRIVKPIGTKGNELLQKVGFKSQHTSRRIQSPTQYYVPVRDTYKPTRHVKYPSRFVFVLGKLLTGIEYIFSFIKGLVMSLINLISGRKNVKHKLQHLPTTATNTVSKRIILFQKLSKQRKIILIIIIILVFVFAQSIIYIGRRDETQKQSDIYDQSLAQAITKQEEAEAALLYGDEEGARLLLKLSEELILSIPEKEREKKYQDEIAGLDTKIQALYTKTKHINTIAEPTVAADLTTIKNDISTGGLIGLFGEELVVYSSTQPEIYKINLTSGDATAVPYSDTAEQLTSLALPTGNSVGTLALSNDSILQYDSASNTFTAIPIEYENQDKNLVDVFAYASRLYFLDAKNNQIFRHQKVGNQYQKGTGWITQEDIDVTNGVSLAIDGSVYVLRSDGVLSKFFQGSADDSFSLQEIDPILTNPTSFFTDDETEYLYVLEPQNKRLLVYSNKGNLKNQYTSDSFNNLTDMIIKEDGKKAYLLNGSKVFVVDLLE
ncbi:hypothetical protein KKG41_01855 [Patescibacteria group bacterium]|nr:hypothetical protein [Patescibacteria group bacterium]MBU1890397.1 hypothetical protein [Patescibacteria group bacterium]